MICDKVRNILMYIPCQIVDSSLESEDSRGHFRNFCCNPCSGHRHHYASEQRRSSASSRRNQSVEIEDPEHAFSRHRAAVIAGHRFLSNWDLQNIAPPLPQLAPPPLPPRRLSSFFPPMEPMLPISTQPPPSSRKGSGESRGQNETYSNCTPPPPSCSKRKDSSQKVLPPLPSLAAAPPPPTPSQQALQTPRPSTTSIACPYLSPIDVAATSWEWDFGESETLRTRNPWASSSSGPESGATDRVNIWGDPPVVKKGLLMQQREKMWSRWKERYFILTRDYLHCFRRLRNVYRFQITLSAMGQFIYKLRLANVEEIRWEARRNGNGSRIALSITHEPRILLRTSDDNTEALHHWYSLLQECICMSKIRRQAIRLFNSSSEEESTSSPHTNRSTVEYPQNGSNNSHSTYTVDTSATSGSSQTDILEIYRKVGSLNRHKHNSEHGQPLPPHLHNKPRLSSTTCGFYLHERPQHPHPSLVELPQRAQTQLNKRFPLPALESESDDMEDEIHDILQGLPKRCANPTREMEESSSSQGTATVSKRGNVTEEESPYGNGRSPPIIINHDDTPPPRCESRVTLRDFVKTPWRSSSACVMMMRQEPPTSSSASPNTMILRELRESNAENSSRLSAFPLPSRRPAIPTIQRPMSSFSRPPPHGVFGGRKVLPTPWMKNPTLQIGKGAAFSRSNVIMCPSKLSEDVTFLRRV
ncbi:unnamed protein product [Orchesella dallaii]|uniref:PH domain-containing protein n=1 Tax=Orchesella dallaii TaxID=48710 RepID=A0ABP1PMH0_9HEXA